MKKQTGLPLNLQLFAEEVETTTAEEAEQANDALQEENGFKPITNQSELDAHTNKAVQTALANKQKEFEKDLQTKIDEALQKQKQYAELSEEDRRNKELEDEKAQFEKEKADFQFKQLLVDVKNDLADKDIDVSVAEAITVKGDAEKSLENVKLIAKLVEDARADERKKAIRQTEPGYGSTGSVSRANRGAELAKKNKVSLNSKPL